jgi:hypothetical protein
MFFRDMGGTLLREWMQTREPDRRRARAGRFGLAREDIGYGRETEPIMVRLEGFASDRTIAAFDLISLNSSAAMRLPCIAPPDAR